MISINNYFYVLNLVLSTVPLNFYIWLASESAFVDIKLKYVKMNKDVSFLCFTLIINNIHKKKSLIKVISRVIVLKWFSKTETNMKLEEIFM